MRVTSTSAKMLVMDLKAYILGFVICAGVFLLIDLMWLGLVAKNLYRSRLGDLMAQKPVAPAAMLFYVCYVFGVLYFAVAPGWNESLVWVAGQSALFGFMCYMTYELTNWAVIKNWPSSLVLIDIVWGTALTAAAGTSTAFALRMLNL